MDEQKSTHDEFKVDENSEEYIRYVNGLDKHVSREIERFKNECILSKKQLIFRIAKTISKFRHEANSKDKTHTPTYYATLDRMLVEFIQKVDQMVLPEPLYDWWFYSYEITDMGICLFLNVATWKLNYQCRQYQCKLAQHFKLEEVKSNLMTVNDYAQRYGIQPVTVRQWIRRGKIRSAIKYGGEWRIPELFELSNARGYVPAEYVWSLELNDIPEKFGFLNNYKGVRLSQVKSEKQKFKINLFEEIGSEALYVFRENEFLEIFGLYPDFSYVPTDLFGTNEWDFGVVQMSRETREELEMYMISNPLITYSPVEHCEDQIVNVGLEYTGSRGFEVFALDPDKPWGY